MGIVPVFCKGWNAGFVTKENRVMTSSRDIQNFQKAAIEVDSNSIPGDSSLP